MERVKKDKNIIPPMTHPYGKHWRQPDPGNFLIDDKHVIMTKADFESLADYSASIPTGACEGKCWRRQEPGRWYLGWFGFSDDPGKVSVNFREILL